jgi:hypothetical protein
MLKVQQLLIVSGLVVGSAIAPVIEFSTLSPSAPASAQFWSWFGRRPRVPLGTRSGVCPMTPGLLDKDFAVISDRPLFAWQGKAVKLTVRDFQTKAEVWSTSIDPNVQQIAYGNADALQPERIYQWQILGENPTSTDLSRWEVLAVMPTAERDRHLANLKEIEQKEKNRDAEAIANAKLAYLLDPDRGLWSDAVQVLSEVKNPSPEFVKNRKDFMAGLCNQGAVQRAK